MTKEYALNFTDSAGDRVNIIFTTDGGADAAAVTAISGTFNGIEITGLEKNIEIGGTAYGDNMFYPDQSAPAVNGGGPYEAYFDYNGLVFKDANGDQFNLFAEGNGIYSMYVENQFGEGVYVNLDSLFFTPLCFTAGTRIATPSGEVAVEMLKKGDLVLTVSGEAKPIRWLGRSDVSARFADPLKSAPIRILAGAFGENLPARDLRPSPAYAVFLNSVLVEAQAMVNNVTVLREHIPEDFSYYHIELDSHELLLAEGMAAESFVDNVDRVHFSNWAERAAPAHTILEMQYPRAKSARQIPRAVRELLGTQADILRPVATAA